MKKYIRPILIALLAALALGQFIRPAKNQSNDQTNHLTNRYPIPDSVEAVLKVACYDCHSNNTHYPWYAEVQPVASWLAHHVEEGQHHFNLSELGAKRIAVQNHKMEEVIEQIEKGEMPLASYTWVHRDAILTDAQKKLLTGWARGVMDTLAARYPADSLVLKKKR